MRFDRNAINLTVGQRGLREGAKYLGAALLGLSTIGVVWALLREGHPQVATPRPPVATGLAIVAAPPPDALPKRIAVADEPQALASALSASIASEAHAEPAATPSPSVIEAELSRRIAALQSSTAGATQPQPATAPGAARLSSPARAPTLAAPASSPAKATALPEIPTADQVEMMNRVSELIGRGDIAGARVILSRLDRAGNGRATFALGQTYDPYKLVEWNVRGIQPDAGKAIELYRRAVDLGVSAAQSRLTALNSAPR